MKIYAIIVTIIAVVALSILGYGVWAGSKMAKSISILQEKVRLVEPESNQIESLSRIMRDSASTFVQPGDWKVISFEAGRVTQVEENINQIEDQIVKAEVKQSWNKFKASGLINDYRNFLQIISDKITNSVIKLK